MLKVLKNTLARIEPMIFRSVSRDGDHYICTLHRQARATFVPRNIFVWHVYVTNDITMTLEAVLL
jgi:hypothetical protein